MDARNTRLELRDEGEGEVSSRCGSTRGTYVPWAGENARVLRACRSAKVTAVVEAPTAVAPWHTTTEGMCTAPRRLRAGVLDNKRDDEGTC